MYASKTPRDLNRDPLPWWHDHDELCDVSRLSGGHLPRSATKETEDDIFDPRPEFDPPKAHNEPNPILVAFRADKDNGPVGYVVGGRRPSRLEHWLAQISPLDRITVEIGTGVRASRAQIDHARKVLTRLAARS